MGTFTLFITVCAVIHVVYPLVQSNRRAGTEVRPAPRYTHRGMTRGVVGNTNGRDTRAHGDCNGHACHHGTCILDPTNTFYICSCNAGHTGLTCHDKVPHHNNHDTSTDTVVTPTPLTTEPTTTPPTTTTVKITTVTSMKTTTSIATMTTPLTVAPTQSTTIQITQPPVQLHKVECKKVGTISQIANQVQASNQSAAVCASGNHTSPEAFTLKNCPLALPGFWKQGENVLKNCSSLPMYTPIAEFGTAGYVSSPSSLSGVFLGCDGQPEEFKIAVQKCDSFPHIEHVGVGGSNDPHSFFVIQY